MSPCEYVLAVLLLTAPPESPVSRMLAPFALTLQPALIRTALVLEILDPREIGYEGRLTANSSSADADLKELQTRYQDLQGAPPLAECSRFPPKQFIDELLATNRAYKASLETRLEVDRVHAELLRHAITETDDLHCVWNLLRNAQYECYYISVRRRALRELRDLIGPDAYCRSQLPPHLPIWHFPAWR